MSLKNNIPKIPKQHPVAQLKCSRCGKKFFSLNEQGLCTGCASALKIKHKNPSAETELGKNIIILSQQGQTYSQIAKQLNCSKSTVSYYLSKKGKKSNAERHMSYNKTYIGQFVKHLSWFKCRIRGKGQSKCLDYNKRIRTCVSCFRNRKPVKTVNNYYTYTEAINHLGG